MITAPRSIPRRGVVRGIKIRALRIKPKKMASPPIRGMGWLCIRRLSRGTSTAPILKARERTTGVVIKATTAAANSAAATAPITESSTEDNMKQFLVCS